MTRHPDGSVTVTYKLEVTRGRKGHRRVLEPAPPSEAPTLDQAKVPRATRMLVLGYYFERLVQEGKVKNYAEIARETGLSSARVTQILNLTCLAPQLQEQILLGLQTTTYRSYQEGHLRRTTTIPRWHDQLHQATIATFPSC